MAKAILEYDLTDVSDSADFKAAVKANDMAFVLWEFFYNTRKKMEWEIDEGKLDGNAVLDKIMERFYGLLDEHGIIIDDLVV